MPSNPENRILVKLRASAALRASEANGNLRPLYESPSPSAGPFAMAAETQWYVADLPDGSATPWDLAHNRLADQLGVAPSDVVFAEPDLRHDIFVDPDSEGGNDMRAVGANCQEIPQDGSNGKATGAHEGWHLGPDFSQLADARAQVQFKDRRTRIAHLDTGYFKSHITLPRHLREDLARNFVENQGSAEDPDNKLLLLDNSGHGTGTLSILAGKEVPFLNNEAMGGAPDADVVPLRIADSVVLLRTSAFARALNYAVDIDCDVLSMSMGGLPSQAWKEAVDRAYLAGLCMITAAGNSKPGGFPTRKTVYPARFSRVLAAYGVMANKKPYANLKNGEMEGNSGPAKVGEHALSAYTPNIPWAVYGCTQIIRQNGAGTSSATPQIAAAAALWFEKYKNVLPRSWRRVEAVRKALFDSAARTNEDALGRGLLRAQAALAIAPDLTLPETRGDNISFAALRVLTGLGIVQPTPREQMFDIELAQRWLLNGELQQLMPDPDESQALDTKQLVSVMDAILADPLASIALRKHVATRYSAISGRSVPTSVPMDIVPKMMPACDIQPQLRPPAHRRLRVYAVDPSYSTQLETAHVNEVTLDVRWEKLEPGPVGEYVAVIDTDAAEKDYPPVDLDNPLLLARDGWSPSEGNAQFHQQMVYAVTMKTIEHFERALGRPVLWRHRENPKNKFSDREFNRQLTIRPHALRKGNAYYSPDDVALQFGYFEADASAPSEQMPGSRIFTCLSHDIIAHETTHAILDGMHRRFIEPTNADVLAFHEAFADIVALMQHFTIPQVLEHEIERTRGDIEGESMLGRLAIQFGRATGGRGALRDAIGTMENGVWRRFKPDPAEMQRRLTPHSRGAILVAAVFDAFIAIYNARTRDLLRIYTGGTGVLPTGAIHPDLVKRLGAEASRSAGHVLNMCIRALDYLPPVDITFFEYLRALITADYDFVTEDKYNYRVAFVEAFRRYGIYPLEIGEHADDTVRTLSVETLRWQGFEFDWGGLSDENQKLFDDIVSGLRLYAQECLYLNDRKMLFDRTYEKRKELNATISRALKAIPELRRLIGLRSGSFEVHALRAAMRSTPEGKTVPQVILALTQTTKVAADVEAGIPAYTFHGGATLILDLVSKSIKYIVRKRSRSPSRRERSAAFMRAMQADPLRQLLFAPDRKEPFAALHTLAEDM